MSRETGNQLLNQAEALDDYLGHLLTPNEPQQAQRKPEPPSERVVHQLDQYRKQEDIPVIKPVPVPDFPEQKAAAKPPEPETVEVVSEAEPVLKQVETENSTGVEQDSKSIDLEGLPQWAAESFSCTQIMVDGIPLAFPTSAIREVMAFSSDLRPVKSQPEWVLGLMMREQGFVAVIDSAHLFYQQTSNEGEPVAYQKVLTFGDGRWGLACDDIGDAFSMSADEVRWRSDTSRRPWLAGMLRHCALIDPDKLFDGL